ncbi:MAG: magnesium-translocating P-type ATPase [Chlorobiaceae bacterium]|nr:magnesium-translocating P-type ATPase [Chlorobiaceae bacterium]
MSPFDTPSGYWNTPAPELMQVLRSSKEGLSPEEAAARLTHFGANSLQESRRHALLPLFLERFKSPLLLILIIAAAVSVMLRDWVDAVMVLGIVMLSAVLGTIQEYRASDAVEKLRSRVALKSSVRRGGRVFEIPNSGVVPGDVVQLVAGSLVPADGIVLESRDCYASQSILTGETFPVMKGAGEVDQDAPVAERSNCLFMGTSVRSGTASMLVVETGRGTVFGQIADSISRTEPENEFERGLRHFGMLLLRIMILIVLSVLVVNLVLQRPAPDTLLFAVALAVGLSPELLPAILAVTLSKGALDMAEQGVIVRRLNSIENLGSMNVLCTDKTGTLTRGVVRLDHFLDAAGRKDPDILRFAALNAAYQSGMANPLDDAIVELAAESGFSSDGIRKLYEIPYDFVRKCLSVVVAVEGDRDAELVTKGALDAVLSRCSSLRLDSGVAALDEGRISEIRNRFAGWSSEGYRVLGVAMKRIALLGSYGVDDEREMTFLGFLLFFDPPEPEVSLTLAALKRLGVRTTIISGDNQFVVRHVAEAVGMPVVRVITGTELSRMRDEALWHLVSTEVVFAEVDPNQKERVILAFRKAGNVVGYLGDGINDVPALQAADVGISVENAVDVAREAADFVLLRHDLELVRKGIDEGRHTFANTLKYIFITTSANFGNMISLAAASLFLPFLPMLAKQVLLNNFLSDIPAMGIAADRVDREWETTPHRWDIVLVRNFMIGFGLVSTMFDMITFGVLWQLVGDSPTLFRTGWFVESLLTELFILFVIRTFRPLYRSVPGRFLTVSAGIVSVLTLLLPYSPVAEPMGFQPLPAGLLVIILLIVIVYIAVSEMTKRSLSGLFQPARARKS